MKGNLTDIELSMVCVVIATRMGLYFSKERWPMLNRNLSSAAREFGYNNINGFIQWFLSAPLNNEQLEILAAHLTISETYFWREPQVFTALTDYVLPELLKSKKKREKSIRIWSAGCSTGEEPYSIAIAIHKTIPTIKDWNITIMGTDINAKALIKARTGVYTQWSFRNSPSWLKSTYFHHMEDRKYGINPEIKEMVTFSSFNLTQEDFLSSICKNHKMDMIFCRNVLMYFTSEWADKISQNLFHSLSEKGWLIVSSCELSSKLFPILSPVNFPGAILYRKALKESTRSNNVHFDEIQEPLKQTMSSEAFLTTEASAKVVVKEDFQPLFPFAVSKEDLQPSSTFYNPFQQHQSQETTPEESYIDKRSVIRSLADKGQLAEALSMCNETIASYKLAPGLYLLRASILQELNKSHEAIKSLKQAIYIDPDYIMGHFTLGNLFFRLGNIKNAKRYFNNALELLSFCSSDDIPEESEGLSAKYIREIILTNLQTQESL
jgi:chemotaxis protein methyltransferase CheR